MTISVNWGTKVILVQPADMTLISGTPGTGDNQPDQALYELDVEVLRLALKDLEDSPEGMPFPATHNNSGEFVLSGVTYARFLEIINGYVVRFDESVNDHYAVRFTGANHNIADVRYLPTTTSLIIGNSAGLISAGTSLSASEQTKLDEIWKDMGLDPDTSKTITENTPGSDYTEAVGAGIVKDVTKSGAVTTVNRQ